MMIYAHTVVYIYMCIWAARKGYLLTVDPRCPDCIVWYTVGPCLLSESYVVCMFYPSPSNDENCICMMACLPIGSPNLNGLNQTPLVRLCLAVARILGRLVESLVHSWSGVIRNDAVLSACPIAKWRLETASCARLGHVPGCQESTGPTRNILGYWLWVRISDFHGFPWRFPNP